MEKSVQDKAMIYKCHVNSLKISPVNIPKKNYYFDMEILSQNNILINIHFLKKLALVLSFSESVLTYCQAHTALDIIQSTRDFTTN